MLNLEAFQGKVKQIVGSTLQDLASSASSALVTNFESDKSSAEFANLYKRDGLTGGHVIMLGTDVASQSAAIEALHAFPGINPTKFSTFCMKLYEICHKHNFSLFNC